ncbi:hypothetical protein N7917_31245 [Bacillus sp. OR9]|nr:hypothetical protein [Bacillus sp. OR9]
MENYKLAAKPFIYDFTHQDEGKKLLLEKNLVEMHLIMVLIILLA